MKNLMTILAQKNKTVQEEKNERKKDFLEIVRGCEEIIKLAKKHRLRGRLADIYVNNLIKAVEEFKVAFDVFK